MTGTGTRIAGAGTGNGSERSESMRSARNAARLLKEFRTGGRERGVSELGRRLGLGKSTVHRLLGALAQEHLVEHDPAAGTYRLSLTVYELGMAMAAQLDLHAATAPVIEELRNRTGQTVHIGVLDGREVVYVERRESQQSLRAFAEISRRLPAHTTSTGKVLLAHLAPDDLERLLDGWTLAARTEHSITDPARLRAELAQVRSRGWSRNVSESETGYASVGAPIRNVLGQVVAGISLAGPIRQLGGGELSRYAAPVVAAANAVSRRLAGRADRSVGRLPMPR